MREIEFRAKSLESKRWIYGSYCCYKDYRDIEQNLIYSRNNGNSEWVDKNTLGQYTGLCDKNGTKIFEGDIVINDLGDKFLVELGFNEEHYYPVSKLKLPHKDCRVVIGNIHDNKELLGECDENM